METCTTEAEGSSEDITGKKKSKLKVLRTRLFGRMRRKETAGLMKQSQSASDVTAEESGEGGGDSGEEFLFSHSVLGSRAMSHDSIFLADEAQCSAEPVRILSQENVHGKIKALQMKLQQQNLHLGPPPLLIPGKRAEDTGVSSEDDGLPHSPPEISLSLPEGLTRGTPKFPDTHRNLSSLSLAGTGSEEEEQGCSQPLSRPLSPGTKPAPPTAPAALPGVDFDSPAHFTPRLDNSAARHRMSVKPRNQRASARGRRLSSSHSRPRSESLNALHRPLQESDEDEDGEVCRDVVRVRSFSTQAMRSEGGALRSEGGALCYPGVGKVRLSGEGFEVGHTDTDGIDSSASPRLSGDPPTLGEEDLVTMNPLFRLPMPLELEVPWLLDLGAGETPPTPAELQKPSESDPPSVSRPQGGSVSVREGLKDSQNNTPAPSTTPTPAPSTTPTPAPSTTPTSASSTTPIPAPSTTPTTAPASPLPALESNQTKALKLSVQGVAQEMAHLQAPPKTQPLPSPAAAPRTLSMKWNTTEQAQQDCLRSEPSQPATAPHAGSDDQPPPEGDNSGGPQRPSSGSFRFSIASAWDRPRGGSLLGREEKRGAKSSSDSQQGPGRRVEEDRPRPPPLSPAPGLKAERGLPAKTSFSSRWEEQTVAASEEPKPREQSRNIGTFQERTQLNGKGKESTAARGPTRGVEGRGGDPRVKPVAVETVVGGPEEGKDLRVTRSGRWGEESEGEKDERVAFGVKLRSTSLPGKYRKRDVPNPEPKSPSLIVEGCALGQSHDTHGRPPSQSRNPQGGTHIQSRDPHGGLPGQSRDAQDRTLTQSRGIHVGPPDQSSDTHSGLSDQSRDTQGSTLSQSRETQGGLPGQSRDTQGSTLTRSRDFHGGPPGQSRDTHGGLPGQSRDTHSGLPSQSHNTHGGPVGQSCEPQGGSLGQSHDNQAQPPTKRSVARGSLREDRGSVPERLSLKPPWDGKHASPNADPPASPAQPRSTPCSSAQRHHGDARRPGDSTRGDVVDLPTDPSLDTGPAPKPASAPPKEAEPVLSEPVMSEPAWMTMAREKTRSLQQLFTSRLPRELAPTTPTATPTATATATTMPKQTPQLPPQTPAPQPAPQHPPVATPAAKGDWAHQSRTDRGAQTEKKKNEKKPGAESTAPPVDKRQERTDRSFPAGGKSEPKAPPSETHSTAAAAHRAEAKMEARQACRVHSADTAPSSTAAQSREREDKQPITAPSSTAGPIRARQDKQPITAPSSTAAQSRERQDKQPIKIEASSAVPPGSRGGQPSWMELAKRKSLAWSDKAMD